MKRPILLFSFLSLLTWNLAAFNADTLNVAVENISDVTCFGAQDGTISLQVEGDEPFTFLWSTGDTTQNLSGIPAGFYDVVVTDSSGIEAILDSIQVGGPDELTLTLQSLVAPTCNGQPGSLEVAADGGTPGYSYLWNTGDTTNAIQDLPAGDYSLTVTDGNGCTATLLISLQPEFPVVSLFSDGDIICTHPVSILDGSGSSSASGTFTFEWTAGNGGEFLTSTDTLVTSTNVAGTYRLELTDTVNGCSASATVEVELDTIAPGANAGADTLVACTNTELSLGGSGSGGASLAYQWSAENGGSILSGSDTAEPVVNHAGTYILTVTNLDNECTAADSVKVSGVNDPPVADVTGGELTCFFPMVELKATADTAGLIFSWTGPNGFVSDELNPEVDVPGTYLFSITDTLTTCTGLYTAEVLDSTAAPDVFVTGGTISCAVTSVQLMGSSSVGDVQFDWAGPNGFISDEQNPTVTEPGEYYLLLTNVNTGCIAMDTATVATDTIAPIADAGATIELTCATPAGQLDGSGSSQGAQYVYQWSTSDGNIVSDAETLSPIVDQPGTYTLLVTDTLNGCTATDEVVVTGDFPLPFVDAIGGSFDCYLGEIQLIGLFDTTNVVFGWTGPNGYTSTEQNPIVNVAGDYILAVTDTLTGCTGFATATVIKLGVDPVLTLSASGIVTCAVTSVQITTEANLNTIVWSWAGENGYSSFEQNPIVTSGGWYTVLAIDTAFGCIALDSILVGMDTVSPMVDAGQGLTFHCNFTSGSLNATASQGSDFSYQWTTLDGNILSGDTTLSPMVNAPGTYTLTVTNADNGCTASDDVVATENDPVGVSATAIDALCFGTATGMATASATGGDGNYSYAWTSGSTTAIADGLNIGTYTVTATDGNGCSAETTIMIGQPDLLTVEAIGTGQSLAGIDDGTATAIPSGGTLPYSYLWSNGESNAVILGLAPGVYDVTVTDANGCTAIASANVNEFDCVLSSSITSSNASCFGADDGTATVLLQNEIPPLQFQWSNGDSLITAAGLVAGIYSVTITDSTNCTNVQTVLITQPSQINIHEIFHEDVECPDDTDGAVAVGVTGGAQPYQLAWSSGSTSALAHSLAVGQYELTITDAAGCTEFYTANIISSDSLAPNLVLQDLTVVLDENGEATITADQLDAGSDDNCGIASWSVQPDAFDCSSTGDQTVTIIATDVNGNQSTGTVTVTVVDDQLPTLVCPADMVVSDCTPTIDFELPTLVDNCDFDSTQLQQTAGLPAGSAFPLGVTVQTFTYTDPAGLTASCTFEIVVIEGFDATTVVNNASCAGVCDGSVEISLLGGLPPYTALWSNGETGLSIDSLCAGDYSITITDEGGCQSAIQVQITEPDPLEIVVVDVSPTACPLDSTGVAIVDVTGGTSPYSFAWPNGSTGATLSGMPAGTYTVTVTDENGCQQALDVEITATDNEAPVLVLQDIVLTLDANGIASVAADTFNAGSTDNCGIVDWQVSQGSFDCSDLGSITVTVTATDGNGNQSSETAMVTIVDDISPILTCPTNISAGICDPVVTFNLPAVSDNCSTIPANLVQTGGLASGANFPVGVTTQVYSYTDAGGLTATCSFTVTISEAATISATISEITCANTCDGAITLTLTGGASPFNIQWSDGQVGPEATGLCEGTISASITDAAGCLATFTTTLDEPPALAVTVTQVTPDVNNTGVGAIQITVAGGTPPYSYAWTRNGQPFASTEDLANLNAGQYTVAVTDANGCEISSQSITVDNTSGTSEPTWANGLSLSPNPASQWVSLGLENPLLNEMEIRLLDITGSVVSTATLAQGAQQHMIDLATLAPGVYMVQLSAASNTVVRRLVVAK